MQRSILLPICYLYLIKIFLLSQKLLRCITIVIDLLLFLKQSQQQAQNRSYLFCNKYILGRSSGTE